MVGHFSKPHRPLWNPGSRSAWPPSAPTAGGIRYSHQSTLVWVCAALSLLLHPQLLSKSKRFFSCILLLKSLAYLWPTPFATAPSHNGLQRYILSASLPTACALIPFVIQIPIPSVRVSIFLWAEPFVIGDHIVRAISLRSTFGQAGMMNTRGVN